MRWSAKGVDCARQRLLVTFAASAQITTPREQCRALCSEPNRQFSANHSSPYVVDSAQGGALRGADIGWVDGVGDMAHSG
jgi:hypothetical protein